MDVPSFVLAVRAELEPWLSAAADENAPAPGLPALDEAQVDLLARWCAALARANESINLTGITDPGGMAVRHVLDSLLALPLLDGEGPVLDLGSGGGAPGVPLAVASPGRPFVLAEARQRKGAALARIVDELGLAPRVTVVAERGEVWLATHAVDVVVTRAVGSVIEQLETLGKVRDRFRRLVLLKGPAVEEELEQAGTRIGKLGFLPPERLDAELPGGHGTRVLLAFTPSHRGQRKGGAGDGI